MLVLHAVLRAVFHAVTHAAARDCDECSAGVPLAGRSRAAPHVVPRDASHGVPSCPAMRCTSWRVPHAGLQA